MSNWLFWRAEERRVRGSRTGCPTAKRWHVEAYPLGSGSRKTRSLTGLLPPRGGRHWYFSRRSSSAGTRRFWDWRRRRAGRQAGRCCFVSNWLFWRAEERRVRGDRTRGPTAERWHVEAHPLGFGSRRTRSPTAATRCLCDRRARCPTAASGSCPRCGILSTCFRHRVIPGFFFFGGRFGHRRGLAPSARGPKRPARLRTATGHSSGIERSDQRCGGPRKTRSLTGARVGRTRGPAARS